MSEQYNGWSNWETWNTYNWISSDEFLYKNAVRYANNGNLREFIESFEEDYLKGDASLIHDFWRAGLHEIDFKELTKALTDEDEDG